MNEGTLVKSVTKQADFAIVYLMNMMHLNIGNY